MIKNLSNKIFQISNNLLESKQQINLNSYLLRKSKIRNFCMMLKAQTFIQFGRDIRRSAFVRVIQYHNSFVSFSYLVLIGIRTIIKQKYCGKNLRQFEEINNLK